MAYPTDAPAAPTRIHSDYSWAYLEFDVDGSEPGTFDTVLNTVTDSSNGQATSGDSFYTFGSSEQLETQRVTREVSLTVLRPVYNDELATILGYDPPNEVPIWIGNEEIELAPERLVWVNIQHYMADGTLVGDEYWGEVSWTGWELTHSADGYAQWVFTGTAQQIYEKYI